MSKNYLTGPKTMTPSRKWQRRFAVMDHFEGKHRERQSPICAYCPNNVLSK